MADKDLSHEFASFVSKCRYEDLPVDAIEIAKKSVLDTFGVSLAASGTVPAVAKVVEIVRESGGTPECSVLGHGERVPAVMAAFANGAMAHALDFDDQGADGHHPSSSIIPAVCAAAERAGGVSGRQLITAIAVGQDMFLRMRRNIAQRQDWHMTTVLGVFSGTASAARVLRLDADQTAHALGIASLGSCGTLEMRYGRGSDLGGLYAGFTAKTSILSALMAQKGVTGTQSLFEGKAGVINTYFDGKYDREGMLADLGNTFHGGTLQYKPWPVCGLAHTYIHAALQLLRKHKLAASDVVEIRPYVGDFQQQMCYPLEERRRPLTSMDARFSLPFHLAAAVTFGELRVAQFTESGLQDPQVLETARKVVPVKDSSMDWNADMPNARLEIVTRDGRTLLGSGDGTPGSKDRPMTWDDLSRKFFECASLAPNRPSPELLTEVRDTVRRLDEMSDATAVVRALSASAR